MPMIDVYAATGTFASKHQLAQDLAKAVMRWEGVPTIPLFLDNTAAFIHELPPDAISNAAETATMCESRCARGASRTPRSSYDPLQRLDKRDLVRRVRTLEQELETERQHRGAWPTTSRRCVPSW